ncbi:LamG domain-containing protein [Bacteroides salyersiae]|nr:LamG domain-containing protein [Bacteroides salyersiae]
MLSLYNQSNLIMELGENRSLIVKAGTSSVTCTPEIALNTGSQLTMVYDNGTVKLYVNNELKETTRHITGNFTGCSAYLLYW